MASPPIDTYCADVAPSNAAQSCTDKQTEEWTVIAPTTVIAPSGEEYMPLPLEADIPKECLPDVLDVYDKHASALLRISIPFYYHVHDINSILIIPAGDPPRMALYRSWEKFVARCPVKFVRKYPGHVPTTGTPKGEGHDDPSKAAPTTPGPCTIGQLDLSLEEQRLGSSNHSHAFLASLTLPPHAGASSVRGEVAVKMARARWEDRYMLEHEAKIYDKFPCELQESTPSSPPVVPKFFGYYEPSCESVDSYKDDNGNEEDARRVREDVANLLSVTISPILLLEPCGKPMKEDDIYGVWELITGIYDRLHNARFIQGSVFWRNILMQPGPLTKPRAERSSKSPSFRLIDFGRGECFDGNESQAADKIETEKWRFRFLCGSL